MSATTIGLDLAKSAYQLHGIDAAGYQIPKRRILRLGLLDFFKALPLYLVEIEACSRPMKRFTQTASRSRWNSTKHNMSIPSGVGQQHIDTFVCVCLA